MAVKLYVVAGHGAGDPGAVGYLNNVRYEEYERVRTLARTIAERMKELGGDQVMLSPFDQDPYQSNGLRDWPIPRDAEVVELHMDSAAFTARGGHVIYKAGLTPDRYDYELARRIAEMFPGRATALQARSELKNCNQAAARGLSYRLVENGFISNEGDLAKFNDNVDAIARIYLEVFGIDVPDAPVAPVPETKPAEGAVAEMQRNLNGILQAFMIEEVAVSGAWDIQTQTGIVRLFQASSNHDFGSGLVVDGVSGGKTREALNRQPVGIGYETFGNDVWCVKAALVGHGHEIDLGNWDWREAEDAALRVHQRAWGLDDDGVCGPFTWATLVSAVNV